VRFLRCGDFEVERLPLSRQRIEELESHLLLLYTGIQRDSFTVARTQTARVTDNAAALERMSRIAEHGAERLLDGGSLRCFGKLLDESWQLKKQLASVTLPEIDEMYETGLRAGAWGGKVLGAGQGGFLLLFAPPERHEAIQAALPHVRMVRVSVNAPGSRVIFANN
jgi:D-glycero-alpha-D-manno-heptose-7-phosphate kinase